MWELVVEWVNERNWWRIAFWTIGFFEAYEVSQSGGIIAGILQIVFWWAFMSISQNILIKDMDNGADSPKWF